MAEIYEELPPRLRRSVDDLLIHAETALWPERRAALTSFWHGVSGVGADDNRAVVETLGIELPPESDPAEVVFRLLLTAYLERLVEAEITNPDQAVLFRLSLDREHQVSAESWFENHPEYSAAEG